MMDLLQENVFLEKRGLQALLGQFALGLVPQHLGECAWLSVGIPNGMGHPARPKLAPLLAYKPTCFFGTPFRERPLQFALDILAFNVLLGTKQGEMSPENLPFGVTCDLLGTRIPGSNQSVRIDLEKSVVRHIFDEKSELLFTSLQLLLRLFLRS